ncbi:MAG TPA: HD-GYP domain-containing protein [Candidatus Atribacteria bacterium]|nr:HD-GYP domain-containing protein [Candidatus Atribacteria bacterium]
MPLKLKVYVGVIAILAVSLFIYLMPSLPELSNIWLVFIFFLVISAFAEFIPVELPTGGGISIGFPVDFVLILVYGPALAMLITALSAFIAEIIEGKKSWYKVIFNSAEYALSAGVAGLVYQYTGGIIGFQNFFKFAFPAALCALTYCLINSTLVTIVISFAQNSKIATIWRVNIKEMIPSYLAEAPMGFLMAIVYVDVGVFGILLFFLPLLLARRSFELYTKMRKMYLDTIRALAAAIDAKDPYTKGHSERVAEVSVALAQELNLSDRDIENIEYTALLHDIGKIGIADSILGKSSGLTDEEFDKIKEHTIMGAKIIEPVDFLKNSCKAIYHHHEKFDGKGYPDGIKSEDIPILARIIAAADAYDAMGSDRPYRKKLSKEKILKELEDQSGKQFDPQIVKALISIINREREE